MAKKRVHEIAKERGIPSKEVLATLQAAGLDVKAAASSVDERDIARAFNPSAQEAASEEPSGNGDGAATAEAPAAAAPDAHRGRRRRAPAASAAASSSTRRPRAARPARPRSRTSRRAAAAGAGARRGSSPT